MDVLYRIAGVTLRFTGSLPLQDDSYSARFRAEDDTRPDWSCAVSLTGSLPPECGRLLADAPFYAWYRDNETVRLYSRNVQDGHTICVYEEMDGGRRSLLCLSRDEAYFSHVSQLWSAVDLPYHLLRFGALTLHSSSVSWNGRAVLFSASSGVGKSTQAELWHRLLGAETMNGDKNCLRRMDDGWYANGFPLCGTSRICRPYRLPAAAVVFLSQAPENRLRRLPMREAVPLLIRNSFGCARVPGCTQRLTDAALDLAASVPVYALACTPDGRAVELLRGELEKEGT